MSIKLTDKGNTYVLDFTKNTIRTMERGGFDIYEFGKKPLTDTETLFQGSFLAHHPQIKNEKKLDIFGRVEKKSELIAKLYSLYVDQVTSLNDEVESEEGNATWEEG